MPTKPCLTLVATASIQDYVFRSNRLKENLGASHLVSSALQFWNATSPRRTTIFEGGGNAALVFDDGVSAAKQAVYEWSKSLLESSPGLRVVAAHQEYAPGSLRGAFSSVRETMRVNENRAPKGTPLGSLPVSRQCSSTGLAAEAEAGDGNWISREADKKQKAGDSATGSLKKKFPGESEGAFSEFPLALDRLGMTAGQQHIAVVHADGNGIGRLFGNLPSNLETDAAIISYFSDTSLALKRVASESFRAILSRVSRNFSQLSASPGFDLTNYFPVRPIVEGGDDTTFVCHGRLGLALAAAYLEEFHKRASDERLLDGDGVPVNTASAGVAIVPTKFPFSRAYQLAEQLCASAKRTRLLVREGNWLDFEIVREGSEPDLVDSREQNYARTDGSHPKSFLMRPYLCTAQDHARSWANFCALWKRLSAADFPRSKAKDLHHAFEAGREGEVLKFLTSRGHTFTASDVWQRFESERMERSPLFDPLDAMDFYLPLELA